MSARIATGIRGLDRVLNGGFPGNSINILMGRPGTGKTVLANSILFANASPERKGMYLGTVSEPLAKTLRYLQDFDFFRVEAVQESVIYEDISQIITRQGSLQEVIATVVGLIREHDVSFLVIDSLKALHPFASSEEDLRRSLYDLAALVATLPLTVFWVGEYSEAEVDFYPEFAVADSITNLEVKRMGLKDVRYLRILKMRGTDFQGGEHSYTISPNGLAVYPRLVSVPVPETYSVAEERSRTGVEVLDRMTGEGFWKGSSTVVFGPPGSGKTLLGLHYIFRGIDHGERGLILSLQENPGQLGRVARGFGWDLEAARASGDLELIYRSPVTAQIDQLILEVIERAEERAVSRVVIDSLSDLETAAGDARRFHDYMYSLIQLMSTKAISLYMTSEVNDLFATTYLSEFGVSHMADNLILLHYLREKSDVKRAITVLKTRGSDHDSSIREFVISSEGLTVGKPFSDTSIF